MNLDEMIKKAEDDNQEHPCMSCVNLNSRRPSHLAYITAQYVAERLRKSCLDGDSEDILILSQAFAQLIRVS